MNQLATLPIWEPSAEWIERANMTAFMRWLEEQHALQVGDYGDLHRWSIRNAEAFWRAVSDFCGVIGEGFDGPVLERGATMKDAKWFPQAQLNFAENLLRRRDDGVAIVFRGELPEQRRTLTFSELYEQVSRTAQALEKTGIGAGDRVVGYLPNIPEAMIAMLATASLGAIWSSCSPDYGASAVIDRFGQLEPKVMFTVDGYRYADKMHLIGNKVAEIAAGCAALELVVVIPFIGPAHAVDRQAGQVLWSDFQQNTVAADIRFRRVAFAHPLCILFSSGTTGIPKCIVHSVGGTLLQHLKEHCLHGDLKPHDRLFYYTTCSWMMWNWLASGLALGATLYLYDGSPFARDERVLLEMVEEEKITHFGTSAKYIDTLRKSGMLPKDAYAFESLRVMYSTGSPLAPQAYDFVYEAIKSDLCLASISGGTDIISCFALGCPILPVRPGELQCIGLGMDVRIVDDDSRPLLGASGDMVCCLPFPSMPVGFWSDADGSKYQAAYFDRFPGVWHQGDLAEIKPYGGIVIHGRSDAVLNPGGVRIGSAEIYRQAEALEEVLDSVVVGQDWGGDVRVVLFVKLKPGMVLDAMLKARIIQQIRSNTTPRHVPAVILQIADIPKTRTGKTVELAVRDVINGKEVKNKEALANAECLLLFSGLPELTAD